MSKDNKQQLSRYINDLFKRQQYKIKGENNDRRKT